MVNYRLMITAEVENVYSLQPMAGLHDPKFTYYFKLRCEQCGEATEKHSCVSLDVEVPVPKTHNVANLVQKCKCCDRMGTVTLVPITYRFSTKIPPPLTGAECEKGNYRALMGFECCGLEPFDILFLGSQWKVLATSGTVFVGVDLSSGDWSEYDEDVKKLVAVSNLKAKFRVMNRWP